MFLMANPLLAKCKIETHKFGTSSKTVEKSLDPPVEVFEPIPGIKKELITKFELICPELKNTTLGEDTEFSYHFIKDKLVAIEIVRHLSNDLNLFEWGRNHFGIIQDRDPNKAEQVIQVENGDHMIQLFVGELSNSIFQNVALVSTKHDDLFLYLAQKEDQIDWDTYEMPLLEPVDISPEDN